MNGRIERLKTCLDDCYLLAKSSREDLVIRIYRDKAFFALQNECNNMEELISTQD